MSRLYTRASEVVRETLRREDPRTAERLDRALGAITLHNPKDQIPNIQTTVPWSTITDARSCIDLEAGFAAGDSKRQGPRHLGLTFKRATGLNRDRVHTALTIMYGVSTTGLLSPLDARMTETLEGAQPITTPTDPESAAFVLARFSITAP